jgi:hypothetical protein
LAAKELPLDEILKGYLNIYVYGTAMTQTTSTSETKPKPYNNSTVPSSTEQ